MTSKGVTNVFREKKILQEEEKSLKLMLEKFQDQLNRLKIEELALSHLLRMQQSEETQQDKEGSSKTSTDMQTSADDHKVDASNLFSDSEDEESQLSDMVPIGYKETTAEGEEDASDINRQVLDLKVPHRSGISYDVEGSAEEMEEEEEEEFNSDCIVEENAKTQSSMDPLRSFMDEL